MSIAKDETSPQAPAAPATDLDWYKDAIVYQLHIRSFFDSNADGVGDFPGLTRKLDYLQDLGVTAIWLLPFYPSPLRDDGYDISDYNAVNPQYGTLRDFREFLRQAHRRGLRVITEMVLNHTSDQHPWFQRARRAKPGSRERDFYVWSDTQDRYRDTRIIFKDFEASNWSWDPIAKAYYWHRFYSHQPDLNFDNPEVRTEMFRRLDFWLRRGVDGVRLDAIPYLFEREGTNCENLPETHAFLKELRRHVDEQFPGRMLLAEANQWPEEAVHYLGDECHMAFHFPLMPRLFMAVRMENRYPIVDILAQTPPIDESAQWAIFLRNHDELTLEMVTDEERDYMYRVYAHDPNMRINLGIRRRLAPLLQNDRKRIELMNSLLFSLPGTPIVYYGDEIGMGDNYYLGDRNAVRTPMQWSADRNAGFSRSTPQRLLLPVIIDPEYHYEAINVETQLDNPHSLLWWMKRLINLRKRFRAFGRGTLEFLDPDNYKVLSFVRRWENECILVVANLSRFAQPVELDLTAFEGSVPVELFGKTHFPRIESRPYPLTLGPHAFYWFSLEAAEVVPGVSPEATEDLPVLTVVDSWKELFLGKARSALAAILPSYLAGARWFGGKARRVLDVRVVETVPVGPQTDDPLAFLLVLLVEYVDGEPERYVLPLALADAEDVAGSRLALVRRHDGRPAGVLHDALASPAFCSFLLSALEKRRRFRGTDGEIGLRSGRVVARAAAAGEDLTPSPLGAEQTNTSVRYGQRFILKLFRRLQDGPNPDLEIGRALTESGFEHSAPVAGELAWRPGLGGALHLGILQEFVANQGDAWTLTLDILGRFFERALARGAEDEPPPLPLPAGSSREAAGAPTPPEVLQFIGTSTETIQLLGQRTAELHRTLASRVDDPAFAPEPFSPFDQRSLYQSMRNEASRAFELLRKRRSLLPEDAAPAADAVLSREHEVLDYYRRVVGVRIGAVRIRCHGDYHLGQVLFTGKDFVIIDFEGEPSRSLAERRLKKSPLVDVAGMLRSFHYATSTAIRSEVDSGVVAPTGSAILERSSRLWYEWMTASFLRGYLEVAGRATFLPPVGHVFDYLLNAFLLQKAVYELEYELNNRPAWVQIPLAGMLDCLDRAEQEGTTP